MVAVPLEALRQAIRSAWSADTSAAVAWSDGNPSKGQCAVTACVVNDHLGGDILHTTATLPNGDTVSHYFNLIDGRPVDLTSEQFPEHTQFSEPAPKTKGFASTREFCLSYEHTKQRYELLRTRVAECLSG
ncbi:YunG family protein [Nocardia sp. NPDC055053]